jgi:hypothetical protein
MYTAQGIQNGTRFGWGDAGLNTPNMTEVLYGHMRPVVFSRVKTAIVDFKSVQTEYPLETHAVIQPLSLRELTIKPEGERSWEWLAVFATTDLALANGDIIIHKGRRYRVMGFWDWSHAGYYRYEIVGAYNNATTANQ